MQYDIKIHICTSHDLNTSFLGLFLIFFNTFLKQPSLRLTFYTFMYSKSPFVCVIIIGERKLNTAIINEKYKSRYRNFNKARGIDIYYIPDACSNIFDNLFEVGLKSFHLCLAVFTLLTISHFKILGVK